MPKHSPDMGLVSIVIPCFNQGQYLSDAIQSCMDQTYKNIEIIVVNDGSSQADTTIIESIVGKFPLQIKYISQTNRGPASARNAGWRQAKGNFIQFLDADDVLLTSKIERCIQELINFPDVAVAYTDYEIRAEDLSTKHSNQRPNWIMPQGQILEPLLNQVSCYFVPACALVRPQWLDRIKGFNEDFRGVEDWYLWVAIASYGGLYRYIDEPLTWYRNTPNSLSKQPLLMAYARLQAVKELRKLPIPSDMLRLQSDLASRHHVLAIRLWEVGRIGEARENLLTAIRLQGKGRVGRLVLLLLTYIVSLRTAENLIVKFPP